MRNVTLLPAAMAFLALVLAVALVPTMVRADPPGTESDRVNGTFSPSHSVAERVRRPVSGLNRTALNPQPLPPRTPPVLATPISPPKSSPQANAQLTHSSTRAAEAGIIIVSGKKRSLPAAAILRKTHAKFPAAVDTPKP